MKKAILLAAALAASVSLCFAYPKQPGEKSEGNQTMGQDSGMGMGGMMGMGRRMGARKDFGHEKASMLPAEKGGLFVLQGKKLYKFDRDLNLLKEMDLEVLGDDSCCPRFQK